MAISPVSQTLESSAARLDDPALELKKEKFLSATKFAVVGASNNSKKWGNKVSTECSSYNCVQEYIALSGLQIIP